MKVYHYTIDGTGARDAKWQVSGTVQCELAETLHKAMQQSFQILAGESPLVAKGRLNFGPPGCGGPHTVTKVVIELSSERPFYVSH